MTKIPKPTQSSAVPPKNSLPPPPKKPVSDEENTSIVPAVKPSTAVNAGTPPADDSSDLTAAGEELVEEVVSAYKEHMVKTVLVYFRVGESVNKATSEPGKYGAGVIKTIAQRTEISESALYDAGRIAGQYNLEQIQGLVANGLTYSHVRALSRIKDSTERAKTTDDVVQRGLTVRQLEKELKDKKKSAKDKDGAAVDNPAKDTLQEIVEMSEKIEELRSTVNDELVDQLANTSLDDVDVEMAALIRKAKASLDTIADFARDGRQQLQTAAARVRAEMLGAASVATSDEDELDPDDDDYEPDVEGTADEAAKEEGE